MKSRRKNFYTSVIVRFLHTLLTCGIILSAFLLKTDLHRRLFEINTESLMYICGYAVLVALSIAFYHITCYVDPGFVTIPKRGVSRQESDEDSDDIFDKGRMLTSGVKLRYCGFCGVEQPLRARHCEDCGRCVRCFDHHCPWLGVCIGELNHRYFLIFLINTLAASIWSMFIFFPAIKSAPDALSWLNFNALFALNLAVLLPASVVVAGLVFIHIYVAVCNITTWEFVSRSRISYLRDYPSSNPFHLGYCRNLMVFLCACTAQSWERVHETNYSALPREENDEVVDEDPV